MGLIMNGGGGGGGQRRVINVISKRSKDGCLSYVCRHPSNTDSESCI